MRDFNWRNTMEERKKKVGPRLGVVRSARCADERRRSRQIDALIRCAQLMQHAEDDPSRPQAALDVILQAKDASALVDDFKAAMAYHDAKGKVLKRETAAKREARDQALPRDAHEEVEMDPPSAKGKDKDKNVALKVELNSSVYNNLPKMPAGEAHTVKRRGLVARLRECRLTPRRVKFLQGDVYHVLGEAHSAQEDAAYGGAEDLRRHLLQGLSRALFPTWRS
jgi:E3 ubiquitin-protein ligase SHPRH